MDNKKPSDGYFEDVSIDDTQLDQEFIQQPELVYLYKKEFAEAEEKAANKKDEIAFEKEKLENAKSTIDIKVRMGKIAVTFKLTDKSIESFIKTDNSIQAKQTAIDVLRKEYNELKKTATILAGVVQAIEHKKHSIINLWEMQKAGLTGTNSKKEDNLNMDRIK